MVGDGPGPACDGSLPRNCVVVVTVVVAVVEDVGTRFMLGNAPADTGEYPG